MAKEDKPKKHFFRDFKAELKKVIWPTPKQVVNSTIAVVTIVLITAVIVFVLDLAFENLNKFGISKIKGIVATSNTTDNSNVTSDETTAEDTSTIDDNTTVDANVTQE